jgi:hypothetical protein
MRMYARILMTCAAAVVGIGTALGIALNVYPLHDEEIARLMVLPTVKQAYEVVRTVYQGRLAEQLPEARHCSGIAEAGEDGAHFTGTLDPS